MGTMTADEYVEAMNHFYKEGYRHSRDEFQHRLRDAVNLSCSCGGMGPEDEGVCLPARCGIGCRERKQEGGRVGKCSRCTFDHASLEYTDCPGPGPDAYTQGWNDALERAAKDCPDWYDGMFWETAQDQENAQTFLRRGKKNQDQEGE